MSEINCQGETTPHQRIEPVTSGLQIQMLDPYQDNCVGQQDLYYIYQKREIKKNIPASIKTARRCPFFVIFKSISFYSYIYD